MKRTNLLFDATLFCLSYGYKGYRTGLYFVACNILKKFNNDTRFNTVLYVHDRIDIIHEFKKDCLLSKFNILLNKEEICKNNIKNHLNSFDKANNMFEKLVIILKVLKNIILLTINNYLRDKSYKSFDVYFSPFNNSPPEIKKINIKQYLILYDTMPTLFPEYFPDLSSDDYWYNKLTKALNKDTYYFCISESTRNCFIRYFSDQLDKNKMLVTHIASAQDFYPNYNKNQLYSVLDRYNVVYNEKDRYIFSFCTLEPRKNLLFTVLCFIKFIKKHNIENLYFYLGGLQWDFFISKLEEQISDFNEYQSKIVRLGYINDEDVNILYSNSLFFTFISQYEGFGLPALEAMQSGTPVICSNNSSLPEVVADAAIMIDYDNEEQCMKAFEDLYFNENLRKEYIDKGHERAKLFSWDKTYKLISDKIIEA